MWELDYKGSWVPKNCCFWTVVLEKTLESPLDCKDIQPVHPKWDQSWVFIGRTDVEAETPVLWSPDVKSWVIGKDPNAGKVWRQEKGTTEDEMAGWHHWLSLGKLRELVMDREAWRSAVHEFSKSRTWLSNWTELRSILSPLGREKREEGGHPLSTMYPFYGNHPQIEYIIFAIPHSAGEESACNSETSFWLLGREDHWIRNRISYPLQYSWASLVPQLVKNPPAIWET